MSEDAKWRPRPRRPPPPAPHPADPPRTSVCARRRQLGGPCTQTGSSSREGGSSPREGGRAPGRVGALRLPSRSVTSGAERKLLCFASRWLRGCIWNIIWTVRAGWRRGSGVTDGLGGIGAEELHGSEVSVVRKSQS